MKIRSFAKPLLLGLLVSPLLAETVTVTPDEDTDVYQFTTYPTSSTYSLGVNVSGNAGHSQRTLVRFTVTPASTGATADNLKSAKLRVYILPDASTGSGYGGSVTPGLVSVYSQSESWSVATARWSSISPGDFVGDIAITKSSTDEVPVWVEIDATTMVRTWLSGGANNGFVVQGANETAEEQVSVSFASMETGFPPELVISTEDAPPPPPPPDEHSQPVLKITRSVPESVSKKQVVIRGRVKGSDPVAVVRYRVGKGPIRTASGTDKWKITAKLAKGKNLIRIFAVDDTGDRSEVTRLKVRRTTTLRKK